MSNTGVVEPPHEEEKKRFGEEKLLNTRCAQTKTLVMLIALEKRDLVNDADRNEDDNDKSSVRGATMMPYEKGSKE